MALRIMSFLYVKFKLLYKSTHYSSLVNVRAGKRIDIVIVLFAVAEKFAENSLEGYDYWYNLIKKR